MASSSDKLPFWVDGILLPTLNLVAAFLVSGLVIWVLGDDPFEAVGYLISGAFGNQEFIGYTLYYATNFIFTGLAVSVAYHAGLFNIGGEGQAMIGGLGLTLGVFLFGAASPLLGVFAGILGAALFGALWAFIPAWLQARRGAHVVITTIMFNFIAASVLAYLLVGPLQRPGGQMPESADFPAGVSLMHLHDLFAFVGIDYDNSPMNISFLIALLCAWFVGFMLWRMRFGYELRVVGQNARAAAFAGVSVSGMTIVAMMISGALAGMMGLNELLGEQHRLVNSFTQGAGFVGIAVAFMGRNRPFGIVLAAILFGALYQGGSELAFEMPNIQKDMIVMIQGLVILFAGAMEHLFRDPVERTVRNFLERKAA